MAALALVRLGRTTGDEELLRRAGQLLATHAALMARAPAAFPQMLIAADLYLSEGEGAATERRGDGATGRRGGSPVLAEALAGVTATAPGSRFPADVRLKIAPGWHVNSHAPRQSYLIPTSVELAPEPGFTLADVRYPEGRTARFGFSEEELSVYDGETRIDLEIAVTEGVMHGDHQLHLHLRYQPCSDRECLAPVEKRLELPITVA
jgi:DsbC/DsbD-like thiol-disulfide interchange protein